MEYGDDQEYPDYLRWLDRIQPPPPVKAEPPPEDPWLGNVIPGSDRRSDQGGLPYGTGRDNGVRKGNFLGDTGIVYKNHHPVSYPSGSTVNPDGSVGLPGGATRLPPDSAGLALLRPAPVSQSAASIDYGDGVKQKLTPSPYTMPTGNPNAADSRTTKMPDEYGLPTIEEEERQKELLKRYQAQRPPDYLGGHDSPYAMDEVPRPDAPPLNDSVEPPVADPASGQRGVPADLSWLNRIQPPGEDPSGIGPLAQNPSNSRPNGADLNGPPMSQEPPPSAGSPVRPGAFDPTDLNAANSALDAQLKAMPQRGKPKWWENLAAGALGGAAGWSNRSLPHSPQIDTAQLGQSIRFPGYSQKLADWQQRLEPLKATADIEAQKQKNWWDQASKQAAIDTGAAKAKLDIAEAGKYDRQYQNNWTESKDPARKGWLYNRVTGEYKPPAEPAMTEEQKIAYYSGLKDPQTGQRILTHDQVLEKSLGLKVKEPAEHNPNEIELRLRAAQGDPDAIKALGRMEEDKSKAAQENLNHWVAISADPKSTPEQKAEADAKIKRYGSAEKAIHIDVNAAKPENQPTQPVQAGSNEFKVAQDLAYGRLTMQQFRSLTAYSRDTGKKMSIYNKASELNPNFNPAGFEMGFKIASNPKTQLQLASLDNVQTGIPDLLKFSDAANRSGATILNKAIIPGGIAVGGKKYSNFKTARTAFADELSGALGYGSATDMSREMGFNMTDDNLSPENFRAAILDVVAPFVERKRASLLGQMGIYGQPGMNPAAGGQQGGGNVAPPQQQTPPPAPKQVTGPGRGTQPPITYRQTATGPNNHKIGSNDGGRTWYDVLTNQKVQ